MLTIVIDVNISITTFLSLSILGPSSLSVPLAGLHGNPVGRMVFHDESFITFLFVHMRDLLGGDRVLPLVAPFNLASGIDAHSLPCRLCFQSDSGTAGV